MKLLNKLPLAIASLAVSSAVFGAMDMDARVSRLEKEMSQVGVENAMGTYGANTAIGRPEVDGYGVYVTLDVLYWHAKLGGTEYAYTDQDPFAQFPVKGKTLDIDFDWDWGVRFGLGYNIDHDGWDAHLWYTYFESDDTDSRNSKCNDIIVPLRGSVTITDGFNGNDLFLFAANAKSNFDLEYQDVVLELGRSYFVSRELSFRPNLGIKTAWIDLTQVAKYNGGETQAPYENGLGCENVTIRDDSDFWGIGPRVGFDSKWHLTRGFSIFGNGSAALLYGHFDVVHREKFSNPAFANNRIRIDADRHAFSPNAQIQLGLMYDTYFYDDRHHISIGAGYEVQYFWRQNQFLNINDVVTDQPAPKYDRFSDDLSLHGLTVTIKWDF